MRFTAQEEYGLRCLLQIAREPDGFITITEIARREALTPAYVAKIMRVLRKSGMVKSERGQKGGFRLAVRPELVSVADALAILGGRLYSNDFCQRYTGSELVCCHDLDCSLRSLWGAIDMAVRRTLSGLTLGNLMCPETEMTSKMHAASTVLHPTPPAAWPKSA